VSGRNDGNVNIYAGQYRVTRGVEITHHAFGQPGIAG
jgi:hypothetical protein